MGVVYRATDTKLGCPVAIGVLPEAFARNMERLARFEREARLLAALNHSNIAAIYGLEECNGVHYLVLELVPGQTLAQRLASGPLPMEEALAILRQIAEALEAAHEKGVVHRDLIDLNSDESDLKAAHISWLRGLGEALGGTSEGGRPLPPEALLESGPC